MIFNTESGKNFNSNGPLKATLLSADGQSLEKLHTPLGGKAPLKRIAILLKTSHR